MYRGSVVSIHVARCAGGPMIGGSPHQGRRGHPPQHHDPRGVPESPRRTRLPRWRATLRGVELCEPCKHLVDMMGVRSLLPTLVHRGGLHAQILSSGKINAGDVIEEASPGSRNNPRS